MLLNALKKKNTVLFNRPPTKKDLAGEPQGIKWDMIDHMTNTLHAPPLFKRLLNLCESVVFKSNYMAKNFKGAIPTAHLVSKTDPRNFRIKWKAISELWGIV